MATASGEEAEEPVFALASECENLFSEARLGFTGSISFSQRLYLLEDYQERFSAWAAFMGVFARPSLCLDRRLSHHPDLKDLVLRYLEIVKVNLCFSRCSSTPYLRTEIAANVADTLQSSI
jgi:hypothetical protein